MTPDARPDVTAQHMRDGVVTACTVGELLDDADRFAIRSDSASWYVGQLASVLRQLQRRLTEQDAEIARLREEVAQALEMNRIFRVGLNLAGEQLTAAEQALSAALGERDEARAVQVIVS